MFWRWGAKYFFYPGLGAKKLIFLGGRTQKGGNVVLPLHGKFVHFYNNNFFSPRAG